MPKIQEITVPDIGDFKDVEIIEVLVSVGDRISAEDPLLTLESDKATMEVPSPADGIIKSLAVEVGGHVSQGSVIASLEVSGETMTKPEQVDTAVGEKSAEKESPPPAESTEQEVGDDEDATPAEPVRRSPPPSLPPPVERAGGALPHASPGIRRFARELGADLNQVRGTGPKGRIVKQDVQDFIKQRLATPTAQEPGPGSQSGIPAMPDVDFSKFGEIDIQDTPRIKKISGAHLHRSWLNIPHVTHHEEADITDLEAFRKEINQELARKGSGTKLTLLAFAMKALSSALQDFPLLNTSLSADGQKVIYKKYFHIGIAVDTPNGLVVPVFRDVDKKGVLDLAVEMAETSVRARDGKLKPGEMQGGSMSISSLGGIGGTAFTPIVNAPEVAILGLTRSRMSPIWNGVEFTPRLMLPLSLSYDHRVVDGAEAARFSAYMARVLNDPRRLLL